MAIPRVTEGANIFRIKEGDRLPSLYHVARDEETQEFVSLMGATAAAFHFRKRTAAVATAISGTATIVTPETGELRYDWAADDTESPGDYYGEFRVTMAGGKERTFPQRGYILFVIQKDLNT